jgi:hypothetical protein
MLRGSGPWPAVRWYGKGQAMAEYRAPKKRLHRDFVYLDHDSVLNSLSAIEAGRVDEIIEKTTDATDRAGEGSLKLGPVKAGMSRKRESQLQEELVRKRTWFSAFEAWYRQLQDEEAIGSFDAWDANVRDGLRVGDTIEFQSRVRLSPLHLLFATFAAYARIASPTSPVFKVAAKDALETKNIARMMQEWTKGPGGSQSSSVYFEPAGSKKGSPRIIGRVAETYLVRGLGELDGVFSVVAQVESILAPGDELSAIRVISDTPATPLETHTIAVALGNFKGATSEAMGLDVMDDDITYVHPAVIIRPIAIYR